MLDVLSDFFFSKSVLYWLIVSAGLFIFLYILHYLRHEKKVKRELLETLSEELLPSFLDKTELSHEANEFFDKNNGKIESFERELHSADVFTLNPRIYYRLGWYNFWKEKFQDSLEYFEKAKELGLQEQKVDFGIADALLLLGRLEEAIRHFRKVIESGFRIADCYYNIGWAYDELGMYDDAIHSYEEALKHDADDYWNHYNIACAYTKMGKYREAIDKLKQIANIEGVKDTALEDSDFQRLRANKEFGPQFFELFQKDREV